MNIAFFVWTALLAILLYSYFAPLFFGNRSLRK